MKLTCIFALFTLGVIVQGNLIAVAQPALLAIGTLFAALNQNTHDNQSIEWRNFIPFTKKETDGK